MKDTKIMLPITQNNKPDYEYMSMFMKNIEKEQINKYINYLKELDIANWGGGQIE